MFAATSNSDIALIVAVILFLIVGLVRLMETPRTIDNVCIAFGLAAFAFAFVLLP